MLALLLLRCLLKALGLVLAVARLSMGLLASVPKRGWRRTLVPKERKVLPEVLHNPRWGHHRYKK